MNNPAFHSDEALFVRISTGDEEAFRILYQRYQQYLQPFLFEMTHSTESTADITQETMLRIWLYREKLAEVDNPKAYIYRIAANRAYTWLKKHLLWKQANNYQDFTDKHPAQAEINLTVSAISAVVEKAIANLPAQRRRIYRMNREEGMKVTAIAEELQLSVSTVKNTLLESLKYIRSQVEKAGYLLPFVLLCYFFNTR